MVTTLNSVNVAVVFKAMGIERDQEIAELIASENTTLSLLAPTLYECQQLGIFSQAQAVQHIGKIIMRMKATISTYYLTVLRLLTVF